MSEKMNMTLVEGNRTILIPLKKDKSLLFSIQEYDRAAMRTPCSGNGSCGKCKIQILQGNVSKPSPEEIYLLSPLELGRNIRLACRTYALDIDDTPLAVSLLSQQENSQVMTSFSFSSSIEEPRYGVGQIHIDREVSDLQKSMLSRILEKATPNPTFLTLSSIRRIQRHMDDSTLRCLLDRGELVAVLEDREIPYGCAIDIGTTTVVVYLVNLVTKEILGNRAALNDQRCFGFDVISRIQAVSQFPEGNLLLQKSIVSQLDAMIVDLFGAIGAQLSSLFEICVVGNTTMLHLLLGVDPATISVNPFTPVFTQSLSFFANQLGFRDCPDAKVTLSPSISAYIGADITSGLFATKCTLSVLPLLFLDIGTNGEIALWDGSRLYCCSTAAGPAFEGASIQFGTGGIVGAISSVSILTDSQGKRTLFCETIGHEKPLGICGSGIIDAVAILLDQNLIDERGAMIQPAEDPDGFLFQSEKGIALKLAESGEAMLYFTQKDVREVQLAKAAIAAGIRTLLQESGLSLDRISKIILAGGFGNYIDIGNAQKIGLLPPLSPKKIESVGNAAGNGAILTLLEARAVERLNAVSHDARYIELSRSPVFMDFYIEEIAFPTEDALENCRAMHT